MIQLQERFEMIARTFFGLEEILAEEIRQLGGEEVEILIRAVRFYGNKELMYRANLHLRTALRIMVPMHHFRAVDQEELYKGVQKIDWNRLLSVQDTFAVDHTVKSKFFTHSQYASFKVKDAIVDQFRKRMGRRPSVDTENPTLRLQLHINHDNVTILLDSSGDSLHKRGYRLKRGKAPLNEVLAAGMILSSDWDYEQPFIDPMCGSGTIVIEAAMAAYNIAPGLVRRTFGFMKWRDFDRKLWKELFTEAENNIRSKGPKIRASDNFEHAVRIARRNLLQAGLAGKIRLTEGKFKDVRPPKGGGILMMNPPYGERMVKNDLNDFYRQIGDRLKEAYTDYNAWIISSNTEAMKSIGLRTSKRLTLYNGPLECRFWKYELYDKKKEENKEEKKNEDEAIS